MPESHKYFVALRAFLKKTFLVMQMVDLELQKKRYTAPAVRVGDLRLERAFMNPSDPTGGIDPGYDDPWGDF